MLSLRHGFVLGLVGFAACGGDDDGAAADAAPDANLPDAGVELLRAGTIAIAQNTVINPTAAGIGGLSGSTVSISFTDLSAVTVPPLPGFENPIGGCQITAYDLAGGDVETPVVDEGSFVISGTNHEPFACTYAPGDPLYRCQSSTAKHANGPAVGVTATAGATITFSPFADAPFVANALEGGYVVLSGFTEDGDASPSRFNGVPLPVVGNTASAIVVANTLAYAGAATGQTGARFANFLGVNPVPGTFQFLDDGDEVAITKTPGAHVGAIDVTMQPNGLGAALDDASALPYAFPAAAADVVYSCGGAGGSCAEDGKGALNVMTISGEASDGSLVGLSPFEMPDDPATKVVFQCSSLSVGSVTMPAAAVQAILDRNPTRVRISVGLFAGQFATDGVADDDTRLLVGNLLTGFTDL